MNVKVRIVTSDQTFPGVVTIDSAHVERATMAGHAAVRFDIRKSNARRAPSDALNPIMLLPAARVVAGLRHVSNADSYAARREALLASLGVAR